MITPVLSSTHLGNFIIATAAFFTLLILVRVFAWKNITDIFDQRAQKIAGDLAKAEHAKQEAENLALQGEDELKRIKLEADAIIAGATQAGIDNKKGIIKAAQEEAREIKDRARLEAEKIKADALESVQEEVANLAIGLAETILKEELTPERQSALIDRYLDQLGEG